MNNPNGDCHKGRPSSSSSSSEVRKSLRKRNKSPAPGSHANNGTNTRMQLRSGKRKKSDFKKNIFKRGSTIKPKIGFSKNQVTKPLCQNAASSVANMSALGQSKKEDNNQSVPNSTDNLNKPSTSSVTNLPTTSSDNLVPPHKLRPRRQKKTLPKFAIRPPGVDKSDSNEENNVQNNYHEQFEEELKCSICSEVFINAVTLNCSHSFCQYCITTWRMEHSTCPICRQMVHSQNCSLVLDKCVEKVLESCREEAKVHRREVIEYRETHKLPAPEPSAGNTNQTSANGNTLWDTSDDEEYFEEDDYDDDDDDYFDWDENYEPDLEGDYIDPDESYEDEEEYEQEDEYQEEEEEEEGEEEYESVEEEEADEGEYDVEDDSDEEESDSYYSDGNDGNRCYNCGEEGHFARNCPTRAAYTGIRGAYYGGYGTCFKCNREGHWANGCPN